MCNNRDEINSPPNHKNIRLLRLTAKIKQDCGSITLLTLGFFLLAISSVFLLTDVAAIGVAKASLSHISELAVQRGIQELDESQYYNSSFFNESATSLRSGKSPKMQSGPSFIMEVSTRKIPIDCSSARARVVEQLSLWRESPESFTRPELVSVELISFLCDGSTVKIRTKSLTKLPFTLPFAESDFCEIYAEAEATNVKNL